MTFDSARKDKRTKLAGRAGLLFVFACKRVFMNREEVNSSVLKSVGYDHNKKILETELLNNTLYEYYKVPVSEYHNLLNAESLGEYYNKSIKRYSYKKLR